MIIDGFGSVNILPMCTNADATNVRLQVKMELIKVTILKSICVKNNNSK